MKQLTDPQIRASFVNCTKGEAKRLAVPRDLETRPWPDLDYLGWRDPQAPDRAYLVAELDGAPVGLVLRSPSAASWQARRSMCSVCVTTHVGGVSLMVAPKAGKAGREGNSVGVYLCTDLACSHHLRHPSTSGTRLHETLTTEERIARTATNLAAFVAKVTA